MPSRHHRLSALLLVATLRLAAAPASVAGVYENEGTVIAAEAHYRGPVSLRALLGLEFDHALGVLQHSAAARVEIEQRGGSLVVRVRDDRGTVDWHGRWRDNGGFEANAEGVKFLLQKPARSDEVFLFILTPLNAGTALLAQVQQVRASTFGPAGTTVGLFYFARKTPEIVTSVAPVRPVTAAAPKLRRARP